MKTALVGWRGMVGTVLMERMHEEGDFAQLEPSFFSTSQGGAAAPVGNGVVLDAANLDLLAENDVVVTCQGGAYTEATYQPLRDAGWEGIWIDAASTLRMQDDALIVLDPVNRSSIDAGLESGVRTFVGGNCTVSLMLMALAPLFQRDWIEWVSAMSYQAASGAGAAALEELLEQNRQIGVLGAAAGDGGAVGNGTALERVAAVGSAWSAGELPIAQFGAPLAANLLPWVDVGVEGGRTREEWKGFAEANKILDRKDPVAIDGLCVRVPVLRCHSQALTIKLRESVNLPLIEEALSSGHEWLDFVPNHRAQTLARLTPAAVTGTLQVAIGRVHKLRMGDDYLAAFTVGDQLLWGAAEPLRRMLRILVERGRDG